MAQSSGGERRRRHSHGDLDLDRVHTAQTVDAFLEMLNLSNLGETFRRANVSTVDHLMRLVPGDLDAMGIRLAGVRVRLQKGLCLLREQQPGPSSGSPAGSSGVRRDTPGASSVRGCTSPAMHLAACVASEVPWHLGDSTSPARPMRAPSPPTARFVGLLFSRSGAT